MKSQLTLSWLLRTIRTLLFPQLMLPKLSLNWQLLCGTTTPKVRWLWKRCPPLKLQQL